MGKMHVSIFIYFFLNTYLEFKAGKNTCISSHLTTDESSKSPS